MKTKIWKKLIYACDQDQVIQKDAFVVTQVSKAVALNVTSVHSARL
jgi:hypothetical protein